VCKATRRPAPSAASPALRVPGAAEVAKNMYTLYCTVLVDELSPSCLVRSYVALGHRIHIRLMSSTAQQHARTCHPPMVVGG